MSPVRTRGYSVKAEPLDGTTLGSPSVLSDTMAPPAPRGGIPSEPSLDQSRVYRSGAPSLVTNQQPRSNYNPPTATATVVNSPPNQSFPRSGAPSVDTNQRRKQSANMTEGDASVRLQEMRIRPQAGQNQGPNASQDGHASFAQRSFAHSSFMDIGLKQKQRNDTLGVLQSLGMQYVTELPELVMVGDQSAGKSSLMSGLAGLDLPRSGGVCTRCPIHIRLSRCNEPTWSCQVSLQIDYKYDPPVHGRIKKSDVTKQNPFAPWRQQPRETHSFKTVNDKSDIEDVLRWAQIAILNPTHSPDSFVPQEGGIYAEMSLETAAQQTVAQFSPNIVSLEIKGPGLPDLSFYDLPGVFLSPPKEEDEYIVQVVRNLTSHYIQRSQAIILWAVPMNQDPENSISLGIIRQAKALDRTVGVMTKADKVQGDSTSQWVAMLRGEQHPVGHGFYITSRPSDAELGGGSVGHWEHQFFTGGTSNWPTEFGEFSERFGLEVLKGFLSKRLSDAFQSSLPSIKQMILERSQLIKSQLEELPELPHNAEHEIRSSLDDFCTKVTGAIEDEMQPQWQRIVKQFQLCLNKMKPTCVVKEDTPPATQEHPISVSSDEEVATPSKKRPLPSDSTVRGTPGTRRRTNAAGAHTPVKREDFGQPQPSPSMSRAMSTSGRGTPGLEEDSPFKVFHGMNQKGLKITSIRNEIQSRNRACLAHNLVNLKVHDSLVNQSLGKWNRPLDRYMELTMDLFKSTIQRALRAALGNLTKRQIFAKASLAIDEYVANIAATLRGKVVDMLDAETFQMHITNDDAFARFQEEEKQVLERARLLARMKEAGIDDGKPLVAWDRMTDAQKTEETKRLREPREKLGPDPYATEIEVASVVRGYYLMAATRFVDSVTLSVKVRLFRDATSYSLRRSLDEQLNLHTSDPSVFEGLMEEQDAVAEKRNKLKGERAKVNAALGSIERLERSSDSVCDSSSETQHVLSDDDDAEYDHVSASFVVADDEI